jgi:hypothetical protein
MASPRPGDAGRYRRRIACAQPSRRSARLACSSPASAHASSPSPSARPAKFRSAPRWKRELPSRLQHSRSPMAEVGAGRRPLHVGSPIPNSRYIARAFRYGGDFCPQESHLVMLRCPLELPVSAPKKTCANVFGFASVWKNRHPHRFIGERHADSEGLREHMNPRVNARYYETRTAIPDSCGIATDDPPFAAIAMVESEPRCRPRAPVAPWPCVEAFDTCINPADESTPDIPESGR